MTALIVDGIIVILLAGSIAYGYRVSKKVQVLTQVLRDLEPLVEQFSFAVDQSEASVNSMKESISDAERVERRSAAKNMAAQETPRGSDMPFLHRSRAKPDFPGVNVVRDKSDLVKRFFELSRSEQNA